MPSKNEKTTTCPKCDGVMRYKTKTEPIAIGGQPFTVTLPAFVCPKDGSWIAEPDVLREMNRQALHFIVTHGPVNGTTLKYLRYRLELKAADLAELLGVTPETFSRWETGAMPVNRLAWTLVARMVVGERVRAEIERQLRLPADTGPTPEEHHLDVAVALEAPATGAKRRPRRGR